jgi:hypothetical protein
MPRKIPEGETRKRSVSLSLSDKVIEGLDKNCEVLKTRIRDDFEWSDLKELERALKGITRSYLVCQVAEILSTPQGLGILYNSMSLGFIAQGVNPKKQTELFT